METNSLTLVFPTAEHERAALAYRQEYFDIGVLDINGDGGLDYASDYGAWLLKIAYDMTTEHEGHVPATTYFSVLGGKIIGTVQIRHYLNAELTVKGGHIGYGIAPSERRRGYGTAQLRLALEKCREMGITRVLITCAKENIASARTIQRCGGVLENEVDHEGGVIQRYWVEL
ncbi:MAG: GNAT family N-acetyltransferase [Oscillospiraceae bacterium]|jgi:predicted acetyltransferase|nr:GNAT family N-acetyltransferase [Oscillospiraceae bacterium]